MFRKSLFGFNKKDVLKYFDETVIGKMNNVEEIELRFLRLLDENMELRKENARLREFERTDEENAVMIEEAEENARMLVMAATHEAKGLREEVVEQILSERKKLQQLRLDINKLRRTAIVSINNFAKDLNDTDQIGSDKA